MISLRLSTTRGARLGQGRTTVWPDGLSWVLFPFCFFFCERNDRTGKEAPLDDETFARSSRTAEKIARKETAKEKKTHLKQRVRLEDRGRAQNLSALTISLIVSIGGKIMTPPALRRWHSLLDSAVAVCPCGCTLLWLGGGSRKVVGGGKETGRGMLSCAPAGRLSLVRVAFFIFKTISVTNNNN